MPSLVTLALRAMATTRSPPTGSTATRSNISGDLTTQCSQCKVIINELLAFINNKVDTLPETGITQICLSAYNSEEIENARAITYKLLAPTKKYLRRKEGSEQKSILEIIKLIKEFEPDCLPVFVAKNLNKLPAVSFDYIDITTFLKEMTLLKSDVACLKSQTPASTENITSTSDIEDLKKEFRNVKGMIKELQEACNTHSTQKDDLFLRSYRDDKDTRNKLTKLQSSINVIAGPSKPFIEPTGTSSGLSPRGGRARGKRGGAHAHSFASSAVRTTLPAQAEVPPAPASTPAPATCPAHTVLSSQQLTADTDPTYIPTYRDIASTFHSESVGTTDDKGFTTVIRKKPIPYKYRNTRGTLKSTSKLQVAESFAFVYLSRTQKHVKEDDIHDHIKEMNEQCLEIEKLSQTRETNFNSFKIKIFTSKLSTFLQKDFWPEGLVFRRYRQPRSLLSNTALPNK